MNKKPVSALLTIIAIAFSFTLGPASYAKGAKGTKGVGDTLPLVSTNNCAIYYAGQHIAIGSVCITISDGIVYIDYILENGWKLNEAHAWAGDSLANVPKTGSGNPIPGQFPLSGNPSGVTTYTLSAPLSQLNINADTACATDLIVAAHGSVSNGSQSESAWAGTTRFTQKGNWATYFSAAPACGGGGGGVDPEPSCSVWFAEATVTGRIGSTVNFLNTNGGVHPTASLAVSVAPFGPARPTAYVKTGTTQLRIMGATITSYLNQDTFYQTVTFVANENDPAVFEFSSGALEAQSVPEYFIGAVAEFCAHDDAGGGLISN